MAALALARRLRGRRDVLPAVTLDVEPTDAGLKRLSAQLTSFAHDHKLPETVVSGIVSVASEVGDVIAHSLDAPPVARLQADADVGLDDAQLVLLAADHRLPEVYASLLPRLERIAARCDAFATQLTPAAELQVWARFRLVDDAGA